MFDLELMSIYETARQLGCTSRSLMCLAQKGLIPGRVENADFREFVFDRATIEQFIKDGGLTKRKPARRRRTRIKLTAARVSLQSRILVCSGDASAEQQVTTRNKTIRAKRFVMPVPGKDGALKQNGAAADASFGPMREGNTYSHRSLKFDEERQAHHLGLGSDEVEVVSSEAMVDAAARSLPVAHPSADAYERMD